MKDKKKKHIHFMGIGGSGISGIAILAKKAGYEVSGCDLESNTAYIKKVRSKIEQLYKNHSKKHLEGVDLVVVSPALLFTNKTNPEVVEAKKREILLTWQQFLGTYLQKDSKVIAISGTHGKSTTTALTGLVFERAGLDPTVTIGALVNKWDGNVRIGDDKFFIVEADEFYDNFLSYKPDTIVINNIEFDHPDYFKNEKQILESFSKFIGNLRGDKNLIVNLDSAGVDKIINSHNKSLLKGVNLFGYTLSQSPPVQTDNIIYASITQKKPSYTKFTVYSEKLEIDDILKIKLTGEYNVSNALGVIILSTIYKINMSVVKEVLLSFSGAARRLELIGERKGIKVIDDYAHHPTAIARTLSALRQRFPNRKIWLVDEPHSYSRTKALLKNYKGVFDKADKVMIGPIYKARDRKKFGVSSKSIVQASQHNDIRAVTSTSAIVKNIKKDIKKGDVVIVMGAGKSYLWAREILKAL